MKKVLKKLYVDYYIENMIKKYNISIDYVEENQVCANAAIIVYQKKYYIYISKKLEDRLLLLVFFHELAHIRTNTIDDNYIKYNTIKEMIANVYALIMIKPFIPKTDFYIYLVLAVLSEKLLFKRFAKKNNLIPRRLICLKNNLK